MSGPLSLSPPLPSNGFFFLRRGRDEGMRESRKGRRVGGQRRKKEEKKTLRRG